ncbi:hypothetical protein NDU88_004074 [Pleurodeles waltl]|uniref:Uncharacterized protein n=1 Tax=Pleurodeles waltl TaxID=8319 RepID=A0AAV7SHQ7_PLEWA|nr:hypothetical protein NDU88_004074 [Pleurodeles waltl]
MDLGGVRVVVEPGVLPGITPFRPPPAPQQDLTPFLGRLTGAAAIIVRMGKTHVLCGRPSSTAALRQAGRGRCPTSLFFRVPRGFCLVFF